MEETTEIEAESASEDCLIESPLIQSEKEEDSTEQDNVDQKEQEEEDKQHSSFFRDKNQFMQMVKQVAAEDVQVFLAGVPYTHPNVMQLVKGMARRQLERQQLQRKQQLKEEASQMRQEKVRKDEHMQRQRDLRVSFQVDSVVSMMEEPQTTVPISEREARQRSSSPRHLEGSPQKYSPRSSIGRERPQKPSSPRPSVDVDIEHQYSPRLLDSPKKRRNPLARLSQAREDLKRKQRESDLLRRHAREEDMELGRHPQRQSAQRSEAHVPARKPPRVEREVISSRHFRHDKRQSATAIPRASKEVQTNPELQTEHELVTRQLKELETRIRMHKLASEDQTIPKKQKSKMEWNTEWSTTSDNESSSSVSSSSAFKGEMTLNGSSALSANIADSEEQIEHLLGMLNKFEQNEQDIRQRLSGIQRGIVPSMSNSIDSMSVSNASSFSSTQSTMRVSMESESGTMHQIHLQPPRQQRSNIGADTLAVMDILSQHLLDDILEECAAELVDFSHSTADAVFDAEFMLRQSLENDGAA